MAQPGRPAAAERTEPLHRLRACGLPALLSLAIHVLAGMLVCLLSLRARSDTPDAEPHRPAVPGMGCVVVEEAAETQSPEPKAAALPVVVTTPAAPPPLRLSGEVPDLPATVQASGPAGGNPGGRADLGSGGGTGVVTAFFEVPAHGRSIVYIIDRSASMGPNGGLSAARRELLASLRRLPAGVRFQVIAYNRIAEPLHLPGQPEMLPASAENIQQATQRIESLDAEGGTNHVAALQRALLLQPDVIYFLSDADDLNAEQVRSITLRNHGRTVIHTIDLSPLRREHSPLGMLARENGGEYRIVAASPER